MLRHRDELVERHAVALHQHRFGDDLDRLVARAAQLGRDHARHLLDGGLGAARDAQQRALRQVARERHDQHRIEREVDLLHLRLVGIARQVALRLVDLGAHVGERGLGVEAGLEFEQHVGAALIGSRAHFLHVRDRLEPRLDRLHQQPLGVFRADAALGELRVDDRNLDVRLGLLRDRHIGDEARDQQEGERREGQPRVADGEVDGIGHGVIRKRSAIRMLRSFRDPTHFHGSRSRDERPRLSARRGLRRFAFGHLDRLDHLAFAHEVLARDDHARAVGDAADPHDAAARPRSP